MSAILILALAPALLLAAEPAYLSPTAIIANSAGDTLYVAEETANQVAVVDAAEGKVLSRVSLPLPPTGLAISRDGSRLYVTGASPAGKVFVVDLGSGEIVQRITAGHTPRSPVPSPDGNLLYVLNLYGNTVSVIDLEAGHEVATIPVLREPVDAALTPDGKQLIVANLLPVGAASEHYVAARVSIIDTGSRQVVKNIDLPTGSTAVQGVCLSPNGRFAYLVHIRGHFQLHTIQLDRGWMNTNALNVIDLRKQALVNTVVLDDVELGVANPWDIACTRDGQYLVIAHAGTHDVSVIDRPELHVKMQRLPGVYMRQERLSDWHTALTAPD
ncbi:MAG: hypothetical protein GY953_38650, partial [bacterium]|nr:hypothetical protein [bacterium]